MRKVQSESIFQIHESKKTDINSKYYEFGPDQNNGFESGKSGWWRIWALEKDISLDNALKGKVETQSGKFSRGVNKYIDQVDWKIGVSKDIKEGNGFVFVDIKGRLVPEPKSLKEVNKSI